MREAIHDALTQVLNRVARPDAGGAARARQSDVIVRALVALATALLICTATAQGFVPDATLQIVTPDVLLGETATVEVHIPAGMDFDLTLEWGDGATDNVDRFGAFVQSFDHTYAAAGAKTVQLTLFDFTVPETLLVDTGVIVVTPAGSLDVGQTVAQVGESVTASVTDGQAGGRLVWGDGTIDLLQGGDEQFEHAYASEGVFTIRLEAPDGGLVDTAVVSVTASELVFDLDPAAPLGEEVRLVVEGLAGNAPNGARLDWGDGSVEVLQQDGDLTHLYTRAGTFPVSLRRLPGEEMLAQSATTVIASGFLDVPGIITLFEPTRIAATDLAPGLLYRLDYGDGLFDLVNADPSGRVEVDHVFDLALNRYDVSLWLAEGGESAKLDERRVLTQLPVPTEELDAVSVALPDEARFEITLNASGLLPGVTYVAYSPQLGTALLAPDGSGGATGVLEAYEEGEYHFDLLAYLTVVGGGNLERQRASATVSPAWDRGNESLSLEHVYDQVLAGEVITVVASGLEPEYGYDIVVNGAADNPYRLRIGEVEDLPDPGTWRVEMPVDVFGPDVSLELIARYPAQFDALGTPEVRDSLTFSIVPATGVLSLDDPVVPYLVPTPVHVSDLLPGLPYRLEFAGDRVERFDGPDDGELVFEHRFGGSFPVELYVDVPGLDDQPVTTLTPSGITFGGSLGYSYDLQTFMEDGEVTMHVRGAAPNHVHVVSFNDGRSFEAETDENGAADITVTDPLVEAFLYIRAFDAESFITQSRLQLPPQVINFYVTDGWQVRLTDLQPVAGSGLQDDGSYVPPYSPEDVTGQGELVNFVIGGRLQDPIPVSFEHLRLLGTTVMEGTAHLVPDAVQADLPLAVNGLGLSLTGMVLGPFGERPTLAGVVTLPTGEQVEFDRVISPTGYPTEGFMVLIAERGSSAQVGTSPWRFRVGSLGAVLDLSTASDYNLMRPNGETALTLAYRSYEEVGRANPAAAGGSWVGVLYPDAEIALEGAGTGGGDAVFKGDLAWTSAGASAFLGGDLGDENGNLDLGGWRFTKVTSLELLVVDDQVIRFTRPGGMVHLPFFGQDVPVAFVPWGERWRVRTLAPVARDYGSTAVVGGVGTFLPAPGDTLTLRFPNALWALDGDLASDPSTLDTSAGDALLDSLPGVTDIEEDISEAYDDSVATAETALNLYQLQLLLKDLTLHGDGAVDLGGREWRTLAKVPALDMFGFPYLGAGAEIGVKREDGSYAIGLRGELKLADVLEANAAPSWYYHSGGQETRWAFEGVGVKFGDFEESPVTFSLVVGGVIDLQRFALAFTGGGSLTIPDVVSVDALGLFGLMDTGGALPDPFWFVSAGVDLANIGHPINVKVQGIDVLAFYAFRGGIASNLRIDVGGGDCRVDDGDVANLVLPSIATNALECYDPDLPVSFLAGTVIGSPVQNPSLEALYGKLWHLDANMVVNLGKGGDLQIAGQGWLGKNLDDGYRQRTSVPSQIAGRFVVNGSGITGSLCAGPQPYPVEGIDCSNLSPAEIRQAGLLLAEFKGAIEFKASWADSEYYFALGRQSAPLYGYVIPRETQGYLVAGFIRKGGILDSNVVRPAGGIWVGARSGFRWDYSDSGSVIVCDWSVWASAGFNFGGAMGIQMYPSFVFSAQLSAYGWASAGGSVCGDSLSLGVSIKAVGRVRAPNPTQFGGDFEVKISLPVVPDIDVTIENVGVSLN